MQICTEILCKLASNGPMNLRNISEILGVKQSLLKKNLKLLQDSSLVVKENFGKNKIFFTLTEKGIDVLQLFENLFTIQKVDVKTMVISI